MDVQQTIASAERVLPGQKAPNRELDPRWQAVIAVGEFIPTHPNQVWAFAKNWGSHDDPDLRMAVATCLLEHLLEHHFELIFPLVEDSVAQSPQFADTFSACWSHLEAPHDREKFEKLKLKVGAR